MTDYTVIGKYRNREKTQALVEAIRAKGKTCYDFAAKPANPDMPHASAVEQMDALEARPNFYDDPMHQEHFVRDMDGLKNADTVVLLLPAGTSAHIEAGVAYGLGKRLVLIGEPEKPETLYHIFTERYQNEEAFLKTL